MGLEPGREEEAEEGCRRKMGGRAFQQQKLEAEMSRPTPEDSSKERKLMIMGEKWDESGPEGLEN